MANDNDVMSRTQQMRMEIATKLFGDAEVLKDPKMAKVLLGALKDADSQELGKKRLEVDNDIAEKDRDMAKRLHEQMIRMRRLTGNKFEREQGNNMQSSKQEDGEKNLPQIETVPGEKEIGISHERYDEFMERYEGTGRPETESGEEKPQ